MSTIIISMHTYTFMCSCMFHACMTSSSGVCLECDVYALLWPLMGSTYCSQKKDPAMVHVRVVGGSHATALHTISLASSTSNTYSSLVIRLAHPWELRISNGGNKTHTTATPLLNTALWYAIPTTEIRVMHWGRGTVEPLYNGHFGTSHFWVIFAVI